jgi:aerobic-type carbon monoxide dehydrogenase small subunit (CoxS/CutS family)
MVLIDGRPTPSCEAVELAGGKSITSIEGLRTTNHLYPLRQRLSTSKLLNADIAFPADRLLVALLNRMKDPRLTRMIAKLGARSRFALLLPCSYGWRL